MKARVHLLQLLILKKISGLWHIQFSIKITGVIIAIFILVISRMPRFSFDSAKKKKNQPDGRKQNSNMGKVYIKETMFSSSLYQEVFVLKHCEHSALFEIREPFKGKSKLHVKSVSKVDSCAK